VQEPFVTRSETKDKPKTQTDNVENKKQVAKESFALKESSANQGSSEWASTTNGSSTGAGSPETKMENKVFASSSKDKKGQCLLHNLMDFLELTMSYQSYTYSFGHRTVLSFVKFYISIGPLNKGRCI